jgi:hypothetical protein
VTTLRVHVGGGNGRHGTATGIHWHMNIANEIDYIATDRERQVIPYVRMKDREGVVREYIVAGTTAEQLSKGEPRRMDCMDCHNRPSHVMAATAERVVNETMARGDISRTLPFIHREAIKALIIANQFLDADLNSFCTSLIAPSASRSGQLTSSVGRAGADRQPLPRRRHQRMLRRRMGAWRRLPGTGIRGRAP